jgi:hypothetical protein
VAKKLMRRRAADNVYLHKDFHGALSAGIEYVHTRYGENAVREYLRRFTDQFYAPLKADLNVRGLVALKEHFERVYGMEAGEALINLTENELVIRVTACPAVTHMQSRGYPVARLFCETTRTVNNALCEGTAYSAELVECDGHAGRCVQRFYRRPDP